MRSVVGREGGRALKEFLGEHYTSTDENMFVSLWKNWQTCRYVDDDGDVVFYRDALGRTSRQAVPADTPSVSVPRPPVLLAGMFDGGAL